MTDKEVRDEAALYLEHGKPLVFGKDRKQGIRLVGTRLEAVELGGAGGLSESDCVVWDETREDPVLAFLASSLLPPEFPTPLGVFRDVTRPAYEQTVAGQIQAEIDRRGHGELEKLLYAGDLWSVHADGTVS
jgi:2-oxoglutarate ferredoxin oxidoreductase subunit beta